MEAGQRNQNLEKRAGLSEEMTDLQDWSQGQCDSNLRMKLRMRLRTD